MIHLRFGKNRRFTQNSRTGILIAIALVSSIKAEAVSRLAGKEANDCVVQFVECFIAQQGALQDSAAVNHECCRIPCNTPVETWDLTIVCQQRICHGHSCQSFLLCGGVFFREAEYSKELGKGSEGCESLTVLDIQLAAYVCQSSQCCRSAGCFRRTIDGAFYPQYSAHLCESH
jgi:hypothetical protein